MEIERDDTRSIAGAGLGLGIAGTVLGLLNGGLGNILGGNPVAAVPAVVAPAAAAPAPAAPVVYGAGIPSESMPVNRYEAAQAARIAALETEVKLRDANTYTLGEMGKLREYVDGKFAKVEGEICEQKVLNATTTANMACMAGQLNLLMGLTKVVVPNSSICPGWGDVTVAVTPAGTTTTTTG